MSLETVTISRWDYNNLRDLANRYMTISYTFRNKPDSAVVNEEWLGNLLDILRRPSSRRKWYETADDNDWL